MRIRDTLTLTYDKDLKHMSVYLFNDDSKYKGKPEAVKHYDFSQTGEMKRERLAEGLYRVPYRDGWKITLNCALTHPLDEIIHYYSRYGMREGYVYRNIRHNQKAYGTYLLIQRYVKWCERGKKESRFGRYEKTKKFHFVKDAEFTDFGREVEHNYWYSDTIKVEFLRYYDGGNNQKPYFPKDNIKSEEELWHPDFQ